MSSAAVQPSASVNNHRQQFSVSSRDQYFPQQTSVPARRPSARSSNANSHNTPTLPQHPSPELSNTSNMTTPRAQPLSSSANDSPAHSPSPTGPSVPPRTSSHRSPTSAVPSSPIAHSPAAALATAMTDNLSSDSRHNNLANDNASRPSLPHEESTILNRLVISDPAEEEPVREQARVAESRPLPVAGSIPTPATTEPDTTTPRQTRQGGRQESGRRKEVKFGDYILGQTLGEGEFGKVKMGWKRDGSAQVAIKLIRREVLGSNPSRLPKIYREIAILRELKHPNIVQLFEMVETERHIGIILEYASGGELFDYILQHRYLKDNAARRLFAQLISGVGYLHKKGIVHRDLKLENLLLDRNRNIIITDFGFANTFNAKDELSEEIEVNLTSKDFVKRMGLDQVDDHGHRRGDLMQTSCGSPCYAAPELVVTDSLYTGRKVDVWSCGVILYAMLAGYLPFDDDPANPEGDNINLLYKYIVSTPLIFPEYVTPHARDLLKRILVPDPRKRADLFEIARHSWLSEYSHVVGFITSSTTTPKEIASATVPATQYEQPSLARSASVREPTTKSQSRQTTHGGLGQKTGQIDQIAEEKPTKTSRDNKRRTVQVEYVAPQSPARAEASGKSRARTGSSGPVEVSPVDHYSPRTAAVPSGATPQRPIRDHRAASENIPGLTGHMSQRPSSGNAPAANRLPSRGSYGQPAVAIAKEQAHGRISQPRLASYTHEERNPGDRNSYMDPEELDQAQIGYPESIPAPVPGNHPKKGQGHRRSNTLSGLGEKFGFTKRGSLFGGRGDDEEKPRKSKKHPPVSMARPIPNDNAVASGAISSPAEPRRSSDSRRTSFSFISRKSNMPQAEQGQPVHQSNRSSRRFSFIPSFSRKDDKENDPRPTRTEPKVRMAFGRGESRSSSRSTTADSAPLPYDSQDRSHTSVPRKPLPGQKQTNPYPSQYPSAGGYGSQYDSMVDDRVAPTRSTEQQHNMVPDSDYDYGQTPVESRPSGDYSSRQDSKPSVLHKRRNFNEAYEQDSGHAGSSGAAKKVMALFTFRRKARLGQ